MNNMKFDELCTGISVEDDVIRLAIVGRMKDVIYLQHVAQMPIPKLHAAAPAAVPGEGEENAFTSSETEGTDEVRNEAIRSFLETNMISKTGLAVGVGEPFIRLFILQVDKKSKTKDLLKKIAVELDQAHALKQLRNAVDFVPLTKTATLAAVRLEHSPLLELFALPHYNHKHPTRIEFVTSNELALINLVRVHFRFRPDEVVHIIHVERDKTLLFILIGGDLKAVIPAIQQGAANTNAPTVLHDRIELAVENAGFGKADSVVLSGAAEKLGLRGEILLSNPDVVFHSLNNLRLTHSLNLSEKEDLADYTVPISLAWQKIQPDNERFHRINLVPHNIREKQRKLRLGWHGLLLLLVLFSLTTYVTVDILKNSKKLQTVKRRANIEQKQIAAQKVIVDKIYAIENKSTDIINSTNLLDTLLYDTEQWSQILDTLATGAGSPQRLWLSEMKPEKAGGEQLIGFALERPQIPLFTGHIGLGTLRELSVQIIGQRKVFRFDIKRDLEHKHPYRGSPIAAWHDSVTVILGDVSTRFPPPKEKPAAKKEKGKEKAKK
jgi:hypothetical protein